MTDCRLPGCRGRLLCCCSASEAWIAAEATAASGVSLRNSVAATAVTIAPSYCRAASEARSAAEEAAVLATSAQAAADERAAELRVVQDSLRSMREECNERWVSGCHSSAPLVQ